MITPHPPPHHLPAGNAIDVYTTRGLPVMHWSPATSQDNTVIATQSNKKKHLVLSQLVVPLNVVDHDQDAAQSGDYVSTIPRTLLH